MWPGREVDHSLPYNADVKNEWSYKFAPLICLHGVDRDKFAFTNCLEKTCPSLKPFGVSSVLFSGSFISRDPKSRHPLTFLST
jgi:hypothetical protein